jgi:hypothetical protein
MQLGGIGNFVHTRNYILNLTLPTRTVANAQEDISNPALPRLFASATQAWFSSSIVTLRRLASARIAAVVTARSKAFLSSEFSQVGDLGQWTAFMHHQLPVGRYNLSTCRRRNANTEPFVVSFLDWKMQRNGAVGHRTSLNFPRKRVRRTKANLGVRTVTFHKGRKIVIHNKVTMPSTKEHGFRHSNFVITHLIIGQ